MENRNRNTALLLVAAGLFLLLGNLIDFMTVSAIVLIWFGIYKVRTLDEKSGYIFLGIGCLVLLSGHLAIVVSVVLISLGYFYLKSKKVHQDDSYNKKQSLLESIKWDKEPWVLKNMSLWSVVGEIRMDLSLALIEQKETTLILQGVVADVDIIVPVDMGLQVNGSVLFGQLDTGHQKQAGFMNKIIWKSPNYETSEHQLILELTYIVGDINIKIM